MKKALIGLAMLPLLTAGMCAHSPSTKVPVAQSCVTGDLPAEPPKISDQLTGDSGKDIGLISGSALQLRAWGKSLYMMLRACSEDVPPS